LDNYLNGRRWLIVNSHPGTGNKFLCLCLLTIDQVAQWSPDVENGSLPFDQWVQQQWQCSSGEYWMVHEPMPPWDLTFFSRSKPRGNDINVEQWSEHCHQTGSNYFKEIWNGKKYLVDFWHKPKIPIWWEKAEIIRLSGDIGKSKLYKKFLLSKLLPWDSATGNGTVKLDNPNIPQKNQNVGRFYNQYEFGPFSSSDQWLDWITKVDERFNWKFVQYDAISEDLIDFDKLTKMIATVSHRINGNFDLHKLKCVYDVWMQSNLACVKDLYD
jgi:hypothetical protein